MKYATAILSGLWILAVTSPGRAQVVFDDTFRPAGTSTTRILNGSLDYVVDQASGRLMQSGGRSNLFHSFSQFDIPAGESATFQAVDPIDTIIARVTGGLPSRIDGILRSEIPNADLFFINPAGVLFSRTGAIELPASFHVTSADSLAFADGAVFSSTSSTPTVTSAPPEAFGFSSGTHGDIVFDEPLSFDVVDGATFSAVGGNVSVLNAGNVLASGGTIQLAAVGSSAAAVPIRVSDWATRDGDADQLGQVLLDSEIRLNTIDESDFDSDQGRIIIRGGRFQSVRGRILAGGAGDGVPAIDIEVAGEIVVRETDISSRGFAAKLTDGIRLVGDRIDLAVPSVPDIRVQNFGSGGAGALVIEANHLILDGGGVATQTLGTGGGADIRISADVIELGGGLNDSTIAAQTSAIGRGGDVFIDAGVVEIGTNGAVTSLSTASGGTGGNIEIMADGMTLRGGGQVATLTRGSGRAGNVTVEVAGELRLEGENAVNQVPSGIFSRSGEGAPLSIGEGGLVRVVAGDLLMRDGAQISARTFGAGHAGQVEISAAGRLLVEGAGDEPTTISARGFTGNGGSIDIVADSVEFRGGGQIQATADGIGDAGNIAITARQLSLSGRNALGRSSRIAAETLLSSSAGVGGTAGEIRIRTTEEIVLADEAAIRARSLGEGATNDIDVIAGTSIVLSDGASISSEAVSPTASVSAGNVLVVAGGVVELRSGSSITAQADGLGDAGNIEISAATVDFVDSSLTTNSASALGGNIQLDSAGRVSLLRSQATTNVGGGTGQGGDLLVNAETAVVNNSLMTANAGGNADAGNVRITVSDGLLRSTDSSIEASAELGIDGSVVVQGPNAQVVGELSQLPVNFLDASSQLLEACVARDAPAGSFSIRRLGRVSSPPDALFTPPLLEVFVEGRTHRENR